jgi:hypothetical protein
MKNNGLYAETCISLLSSHNEPVRLGALREFLRLIEVLGYTDDDEIDEVAITVVKKLSPEAITRDEQSTIRIAD